MPRSVSLAKRSETAIYTIGLKVDDGASNARGFKEAEFVMRQFAQETGGRSFFPTQISELFAVSDRTLLMPPKSTWFEPKLRSGLFLHAF